MILEILKNRLKNREIANSKAFFFSCLFSSRNCSFVQESSVLGF